MQVEVERCRVEDLADPSHLARFGPGDHAHACDAFGALKRRRDFFRVSFKNVRDLVEAKQDLRRIGELRLPVLLFPPVLPLLLLWRICYSRRCCC